MKVMKVKPKVFFGVGRGRKSSPDSISVLVMDSAVQHIEKIVTGNRITNWELLMRSTFKIELKMDMPQGDEETREVMRHACREAARTVFAAATMVSDKRKPMVAVFGDFGFDGEEKIDVDFYE